MQFTQQELQAFLDSYRGQVASVHEDTEVSVFEMEHPAPWGLDRLDQTALPLNQDFDYYNLGTGVNVYIVDTVWALQVHPVSSLCMHVGCRHAHQFLYYAVRHPPRQALQERVGSLLLPQHRFWVRRETN